jgi:hypothetical protein
MRITINRRELLLLGAATACPTIIIPGLAHATIPPPPSSPYYLWFIADGIYKIGTLLIVKLPSSAGTCQNYTASGVSIAFGANFTFTGRNGVNRWNAIIGAPLVKWWEVLDKRSGRYIKIYELDRLEAKFSDGSRVKVRFNGPYATLRFEPLVGTERLPDGTRLYPREGEHEGREKGRDGSGPTSVTPGISTFSWSWSSQAMPW